MALRFGNFSVSQRICFYEHFNFYGKNDDEWVDRMIVIKRYLGVNVDEWTPMRTLTYLYERAKREHDNRQNAESSKGLPGRR